MNTRTSANEKAPTFEHQRIAIASDLLADAVPQRTEVSLFGFRLKRRKVKNVWTVHDEGTGVDAINLMGTPNAIELLSHLESLRKAIDEQQSGVRSE